MGNLVEGKVAIVTGGASGLGRAIAQRLDREGAGAVVIVDVREEPREGGTPTHESLDCETQFVQCDQADREQVRAAVEATDRHGHIDVLVNAAGMLDQHDFFAIDDAAFHRTMDVNLKGPLAFSQMVGERMVRQGSGSIINIASIVGVVADGTLPLYSMSKGAVRTLTNCTAAALGPHGVRVNAILPGVIDSAMTRQDVQLVGSDLEASVVAGIPLRRVGSPQDIAGAAAFLASDLAGYVSATSLVVDGGQISTLTGPSE